MTLPNTLAFIPNGLEEQHRFVTLFGKPDSVLTLTVPHRAVGNRIGYVYCAEFHYLSDRWSAMTIPHSEGATHTERYVFWEHQHDCLLYTSDAADE